MKNKIAIICVAVILSIVLIASVNPIEDPLVFTFVAVIIAIPFVIIILKNKKLSRLPELTIKATVVYKEIVKENNTVPDGSGGYYESEETHYRITFETEHHIQWSFNVSLELFNAVIESDTGIVTYKESKQQKIYFVSFQRQT